MKAAAQWAHDRLAGFPLVHVTDTGDIPGYTRWGHSPLCCEQTVCEVARKATAFPQHAIEFAGWNDLHV